MALTAQDYYDCVQDTVARLDSEGLRQKIYSDTLDEQGNQYVDLVMEGGGVLGIALLGYVYILEQAGLRFVSIGGTSAGAISALALAAAGAPQEKRSDTLVEIVSGMPMNRFLDGKHDGDNQAADFIYTMIKRPSLLKGAWKGLRVIDNFKKMLGLNRGDFFENWLARDVLAPLHIRSTADLRKRMAQTPLGWHLRPGSPHAASQLDGASCLPPLDPAKNYLCLIAADISTETKVSFPRMAPLYWSDPDAVNPAVYARCSMSIPFVFKPYAVGPIPTSGDYMAGWRECAGISPDDITPGTFPPSQCLFVDGGTLSNFPIDAFHNYAKIPSRPTFGAKLQWDERSHEIDGAFKLLAQIFNSARHCLDYDFIVRNPDFKQLVAIIDTADHDWLNFDTPDADRKDLFARGANAAYTFLKAFDWDRYKQTRAELLIAHRQAERPTPP